MDLNQSLMNAFQVEHLEHLERIRSMLLVLERQQAPCAGPELEEAFRCAHSLKGAARITGLGGVETLAHRLESLFARLRGGDCAIDKDINDILEVVRLALDGIEDAAATALRGDEPANPQRLIAELDRLLEPESKTTDDSARTTTANAAGDVDAARAAAEAPATPAPVGLHPARRIDSVRLSAESLDRLLKCSGQLLTTCLQQDGLALELQGLLQDITEIKKLCTNWRGTAAAERDLRGPSDRLPDRSAGRFSDRASAARRGELIDHQLLALGKRTRAIAQTQRRNAWSHRLLTEQLRADVCRARMVPAEDIFQCFRKMMRDLANDQAKQVDFRIDGMETEADRTVLQALKDPLMHVLRNAICHGIEMPAERVRLGKPPEGKVNLHIEATGSRLIIAIEDDGRGVDVAQVIESAVQQGLVSEAEAHAWPPEEVLNLLVRPGFTTCANVSELAGRGMGLSVAHEIVTGLQGEVAIRPGPGAGTVVSLSVPLTISTHRILLVSCQGQLFGIPVAGIENVLRLNRQEVESLEGRPMISVAGQLVPVFTLSHLLELADAETPLEGEMLQLVVLKYGTRRVAVAVDALLQERTAVIQSLGRLAAQMSRFVGGIIQEDGSVSLVLNPADLIERSKQSARPASFKRAKTDDAPPPTVLVVDDSFTTRTLETNILESHGYRVRIAIDGIEALNELRAERIDLVICDVQMPRLDGLGLLAEMKKDSRLAQIPVIIVSSLDRREDQERGLSLGADAYLVKQKFDHQELLHTIEQIV